MFERFAADARAAVTTAGELATGRSIGREHILVALAVGGEPHLRAAGADPQRLQAALAAADPDASDASALASLGIDLPALAATVDRNFGSGTWAHSGKVKGSRGRISPGARKTLELSLREAMVDHSRTITTEHLLRGLLRDPGDAATTLIETFSSVRQLQGQLRRAS